MEKAFHHKVTNYRKYVSLRQVEPVKTCVDSSLRSRELFISYEEGIYLIDDNGSPLLFWSLQAKEKCL